MSRVIVSNLVTLDGYIADPQGELDWHKADAEFDAFAAEQLHTMDMILFGRVTYEGMESYWPTPAAIADDPEVAERMNTLPKVVFSKTLKTVKWGEWDNARLAQGDLAEEIAALKREARRDLVIFGSGRLVASLTQRRLIDEYRLLIHPALLGGGQSMYPTLTEKIDLRLLDTRTFGSGVVLLRYEVK
jgi:dihydrofolate reductase